jgi:hypothetical protein
MRAAHREYGVRVPSRSAPFAWFGLGQDGLAIRTGQLRSIRSRLTRSWSRSREIPRTFDRATSKATPHGVSSDGPPAPHRLEQPSPCTSPISDALRHQRGHRPLGSRTKRQLAERLSCDERLAFTYVDQDPRPRDPCGAMEQRSGRLPSCHTRPGCPGRQPRTLSWVESVARLAHRSHHEAAATCVNTYCGVLLGQRRAADLPCGSPGVATRDALDRLLPSHFFVPVPAHRWFSLHRALARPCNRGAACSTTVRFASAGCTSRSTG